MKKSATAQSLSRRPHHRTRSSPPRNHGFGAEGNGHLINHQTIRPLYLLPLEPKVRNPQARGVVTHDVLYILWKTRWFSPARGSSAVQIPRLQQGSTPEGGAARRPALI